ncbi:MAG: hypothetical protein CME62_11560 [Halobacteriovoraceae bacterium]|nr:hypothetical protein [Halobacteriovoraceae bacterium]|tara:strand:- start:243 stop:1430 length:1188 start_codon:yes stop_codon:yes gene_type:complete
MILPKNPLDVFHIDLFNKLRIYPLLWLAQAFGLWKKPRLVASGDIESMTFLDKVYWLYKIKHPVHYPDYDFMTFDWLEMNSLKKLSDVQSPQLLTLSAVGDLLNHPYLINSRETLYADIFEQLFEHDLAMANLECCIDDQRENDLNFSLTRAPRLSFTESEFDIVRGGFTFMSSACNHSFDLGEEGVNQTLFTLKKNNIQTNGLNRTPEESLKGTIIEKAGFRLGVICHTFGLNGHNPPADKKYLVNYTKLNSPPAHCNLEQIKKQISFLENENVDFKIAHLHWGWEHEFYPRQTQIELAHHLAELGIDLIIGHHPHVIQPTELYQTQRDSRRIVPIFYSLGNLTNGFSQDFLCQSLLATLSLGRLEDGTVLVHSVKQEKLLQQVVGDKIKITQF